MVLDSASSSSLSLSVRSAFEMASVPYELIAASKPFRFLVGPDKKEFMMHAELVAGMSKPLYTLVKGGWEEGKTSLAEWPDVDEGTFVRFCEYAYTGDYRAAEPIVEPSTASESLDNDWMGWGQITSSQKKKKKGKVAPKPFMWDSPVPDSPAFPTSSKQDMWQEFREGVGDEVDRKPKEEPNADPLANYSEVLLSHARLYAFADCYAVDALMGLCVRKLHRVLNIFDLHEGARVTDVAQLIDFSYKNTPSREGEPDKLRSLLASYMACKIEELWPNVYFRDVLDSGEVSKAIIGQLLKRLN
ncbi:hypothetical protein F4677DRAFT_338262 [Hypoxylon crocopeplum]|nr:hypothetical protein F4677DRAFT_338262 [Hypoxylon crocopeplum]